jgi:transcriptional regulator with AAA-type ATPase domain
MLLSRQSPRWPRPFVCINCAAIPDMLLESELFGYEKGAFTGANTASEGKLKLADGGAIFFDEIGDMSPYAQAKILRAIESREVYRLGGKCRIPVNVRVLAATNHDLEQSVAQGQFRKEMRWLLVIQKQNIRKEPMPIMLRITSFSLSEGRRVRAVRMVARSGFPHPDPVPLGEGGKRRSGHDTRTRFLRK